MTTECECGEEMKCPCCDTDSVPESRLFSFCMWALLVWIISCSVFTIAALIHGVSVVLRG